MLTVRTGAGPEKRAEIVHEWHKSLLHKVVPPLIEKWERKLKVEGYFLQRMKTKWGSCNHRAGNIRLNTELVKKPKDLLELGDLRQISAVAPRRFRTHLSCSKIGVTSAPELSEAPMPNFRVQ